MIYSNERGSIIEAQLNNPRFVKCKSNNLIRFVTNLIPSIENFRFEDDGVISGQKPSNSCNIEDYHIDVLKIDPYVVTELHLWRRRYEKIHYSF